MSQRVSLRLFVATSVPEVHLRWVQERATELQELWPGARWTPPDNRHITLKFLGSTPEDMVDDIVARCEDVAGAHPSASVALRGLGVFPSLKRAGVLWVGLHDPSGLLTSLAGALDAELAALGFEPEKRTYSPHLTLARFRTPVAISKVPELPRAPGPFSLDSFGLWRSHLSPKGARYERLVSFPLAEKRSS